MERRGLTNLSTIDLVLPWWLRNSRMVPFSIHGDTMAMEGEKVSRSIPKKGRI
jgi:hypothetical protein